MTEPLLRIPATFTEVAERLGHLPEEAFRSLVSLLSERPSKVHRSELTAALDRATQWESGTSDRLLSMVTSLRHVGESLGQGLEQGATLAEVISRASNLPSKIDRHVFAARILALLESTAIDLLARAEALLDAHEHRLSEVRILSDVRPLFDPVDESQIDGAVIGHVLRLALIGGGEPASFDVALDLEDLKKLRAAVDRAFRKQQQLEQIVTKADVPLVVPYDVPVSS